MRITWERGDVVAGRKVAKRHNAEHWIIGYNPSTTGGERWALISLKDGKLLALNCSDDVLATFLNQMGCLPTELYKWGDVNKDT